MSLPKSLSSFRFALPLLLSIFFFPANSFAETVSIVTGNGTEALLVEASMKRLLRAEGYTVKGGTTDGYVLNVAILPSKSKSGIKWGVIGHLSVLALGWQDLGDTLISDKCRSEHEMAQQFKEIVGTRVIYINSTIATAPDEDALAELLSTFANRQIRLTSEKVTKFFNELEASKNREISAPSIEQMR